VLIGLSCCSRVANVAHLAMLARYFAFPLPIAFDALIALGLAAAAFSI
jgi:hypothetical protein